MLSLIILAVLFFFAGLFILMKNQVDRKIRTLSQDEFRAWFQKNYLGLSGPLPMLGETKGGPGAKRKSAA